MPLNRALAATVAVLALAAGPAAHAEIEKSPKAFCVPLTADAPADACANAWPKLALPEGWLRDADYSNETGVNHLYYEPDPTEGSIYAGVDAVATAATLDDFIAADKDNFTDYTVTQGPVFATADGQAFRSQIFTPRNDGDTFEMAVYGEEAGDDGQRYYLTFVLTAPNQAQQDKYLPAFTAILAAYHR